MMAASGLVFDRVAEEYDRVRPSYPAPLVETACSIGGLDRGSNVVEVGCGTGKLTRLLAERGLRVEAVDPGPELIEIARRHVAKASVRFHVARFEDVALPAGAFDAVFSATAFHWVDPAIGWSKAARLLRPGGVLGLLAYVGGGANLLGLPGVLAAWREVLPEAANWKPRDAETIWRGVEARRANVSEVWAWLEKRELGRAEAAELFQDVKVTRLPIERERTVADVLAFVRTTSGYLGLDVGRQKLLERRLSAALEQAGETFRSTTFATLVTARVASEARITIS